MISYIQEVMDTLKSKRESGTMSEAEAEQVAKALESMQSNLDTFKPVIDAHNEEYKRIIERDREMEKIIHEFKNSLLIEKIKLDTWENRDANK